MDLTINSEVFFEMAGFNFGDFAKALAETKLSGVNFVGQAKNWGTTAEGM